MEAWKERVLERLMGMVEILVRQGEWKQGEKYKEQRVEMEMGQESLGL